MLTWRAVRPKRQAQRKTPNRHTEYQHIVMRLSLPAGGAHVVAMAPFTRQKSPKSKLSEEPCKTSQNAALKAPQRAR